MAGPLEFFVSREVRGLTCAEVMLLVLTLLLNSSFQKISSSIQTLRHGNGPIMKIK